jgi:hypothetical protein
VFDTVGKGFRLPIDISVYISGGRCFLVCIT